MGESTQADIDQAKKGCDEGGIPISLARVIDGGIFQFAPRRRVQKASPCSLAELVMVDATSSRTI